VEQHQPGYVPLAARIEFYERRDKERRALEAGMGASKGVELQKPASVDPSRSLGEQTRSTA